MVSSKVRVLLAFGLSLALVCGIGSRVQAQGTIGSILGTVTDASGAVIAGARVQAVNTGTNSTQTATTDGEGRYRIPALPVGDYDVQSEITGFQTAVRKAIRLSAGADVVIDFAMTVGQVSQTVIVEAAIPQVETTSAALGNVVEPTQMRELPLNGRNFEELVQLAPGVNVSRGSGASQSSFTGKEDYWTVSGSRPNGQAILMDGTNIQTYQDRGTGSGILGTSLGVDAIGEFQLLTNTYGAQYGGNGSVMNSVTRSGTNAYHGSGYEFTRNSIWDATPWQQPSVDKPEFWKHQYGGTFGGPIKHDKMFFFANYEGLRQQLGDRQTRVVPNALVRQGIVASAAAIAPCVVTTAYTVPVGSPVGTAMYDCGPTSPNAANFAKIKPYLDQYPLGVGQLGTGGTDVAIPGYEGVAASSPDPTFSTLNQTRLSLTAPTPGHEYFLVGRYDWTLSDKDSVFARYLFDDAYTIDFFRGSFPAYPEYADSRNQFLTIGEKRVVSTSVVNTLNLGYVRTFFDIRGHATRPTVTPGVLPAGSLNWSGDLWTRIGEDGPTDGTIAIGGGVATIGGPQIGPIRKLQIKKAISDDIFWVTGGHSLRFGGSVTHSMTDGLHPFPGGGTWTFQTIQNFLRAIPQQYSGPCNFYNIMPACTFKDGSPLPIPDSFRKDRHWEFTTYIQDDWKLRPNLTVNLGLRYAPTTNPYDATRQIYLLLPVPYGENLSASTPASFGTPPPSELTPASNFFLRNPSLRNFDPRIGVAWSPFKGGKTSIRAGYGLFHAVLQCRDYCYGSWFTQPWTIRTYSTANNATAPNGSTVTAAQLQATFPRPHQIPITIGATSATWGTNPYQTTPYMQQWNLSVQREILKDTILTVAYVGSHGVHMVGQRDANPPLPSGAIVPYTNVGAITLGNLQTLIPNFPGYNDQLVNVTGSINRDPATGNITCTSANPLTPPLNSSIAACTLATVTGKPIVNPATGKMSYAHVVGTSAVANTRWNPNFAHMNEGMTDLESHYNAFQMGVVRRLTKGISAQMSYSYQDCNDVSSGNWSQEGGTRIIDAYNLELDRGPCTFSVRHNMAVNGVYQLPFRGNRLFEGWQISGIFNYNHGGPFSISAIQNTGNEIGNGAPLVDYVPNAAGCNAQPVNEQFVTNNGVDYLNEKCFAIPAVGETGNSGRNHFKGPKQINFNTSVQKNTKLTERYSLQIRAEGFNVFNRRNFSNPSCAVTQTTGAVTGTINSDCGVITGIVGTARQLQFGAKLTF